MTESEASIILKSEIVYHPECSIFAEALGLAIQALEKQISGCWVPCKDRLPEDDSICIVTVEYPNNETMVDYGWFDRNGVCWFVGMHEFRTSNVLAWQPLPEPFKERD